MKSVPLFKVVMPPEADAAVAKTLQSGYLAEGPRVQEFKEAFSSRIGNEYVVPMSSCTIALTISYDLAGIGPGDEVISTPLTSICANMPFVHKGAKVVWADCEKGTGMIDPQKLPEIITSKTKAISVLHKDGDLAKMDEILDIARTHNLKVIEDAAHAFGARYRDKPVGTIGDYTCFSFQAIKHVTTGDGGVLSMLDADDYAKARKMKWMGVDKAEVPEGINPWSMDIALPSYKGNMNDIAASIGLQYMKHADEIVSAYRRNGALYTEGLSSVPGVTLIERDSRDEPVYWTYVILVENRDRVIQALKEEGVSASHVHPRNDRYSIFSAFQRDLPGVDYFDTRELSLPCGPWVTPDDIERIVGIIKKHT